MVILKWIQCAIFHCCWLVKGEKLIHVKHSKCVFFLCVVLSVWKFQWDVSLERIRKQQLQRYNANDNNDWYNILGMYAHFIVVQLKNEKKSNEMWQSETGSEWSHYLKPSEFNKYIWIRRKSRRYCIVKPIKAISWHGFCQDFEDGRETLVETMYSTCNVFKTIFQP